MEFKKGDILRFIIVYNTNDSDNAYYQRKIIERYKDIYFLSYSWHESTPEKDRELAFSRLHGLENSVYTSKDLELLNPKILSKE